MRGTCHEHTPPAIGAPLAGVNTGSFGGYVVPPDVIAKIVNLVISARPLLPP